MSDFRRQCGNCVRFHTFYARAEDGICLHPGYSLAPTVNKSKTEAEMGCGGFAVNPALVPEHKEFPDYIGGC